MMVPKAGDERLGENKEGPFQSDATLERNVADGRLWGESMYEEGL